MEEHGKVVYISPIRSGVSARNQQQWMSLDFVLEIDGRYTRYVRLSLFGEDKIRAACLQVGIYLTAKFEIEAHQTKGEWYNDLRCYDIISDGISRIQGKQKQVVQQQTQIPVQQVQQSYAQPVVQNQGYAPSSMPYTNVPTQSMPPSSVSINGQRPYQNP